MAKTKLSRRSGISAKSFLSLLAITFLVITIPFSVKWVQERQNYQAEAKTARVLKKDYWPDGYKFLNNVAPTTWAKMGDARRKITFTQRSSNAEYYAYYAKQFTDTQFPWKSLFFGNDSTRVQVYGYTTAQCGASFTGHFQFNPIVNGSVAATNGTHMQDFNTLSPTQCGQDPERPEYRWFVMDSEGGSFGTFKGNINQGVLRFHRYDQTNNNNVYNWEVDKVVLCNPSNGVGCSLDPWCPTCGIIR